MSNQQLIILIALTLSIALSVVMTNAYNNATLQIKAHCHSVQRVRYEGLWCWQCTRADSVLFVCVFEQGLE